MQLSFKLCFVALFVHYIGIVQLRDEALAEFVDVFPPEGIPLLHLLRGEAFCLGLFCKGIYALYFFGYHIYTSGKSVFIIPLKEKKVDIKMRIGGVKLPLTFVLHQP